MCSANELVDIIGTKTGFYVMIAAHFNFGMNIFIANGLAGFIDINHGSRNIEKGDHFVAVFIDHKRMDFTWGLKDVASGGSDPVVFKVSPFAFDDISVDGCGMSVA